MISGLASAAAHDARADDEEGLDRLPESFRRAYDRHVDFGWRNLRRLGVAEGDLEDAVQETFVVAYRRRASVREGVSLRGWLYGVVRRIASRFRRGAGRRGRLRLAVAAVPEPAHDLARSFEEREAWRLVEQFVIGLSDDKRDVFVLAELEGMTGQEIAALLGINPNTVGSRLRSARAAFARWLDVIAARERGVSLRLQHAAVIEAGRRAPGPDRERKASVGSALAVQLATGSGAGGWSIAASVRAFLLTVAVGTTGVVATAIALPDREAPSGERDATSREQAATDEPRASAPTPTATRTLPEPVAVVVPEPAPAPAPETVAPPPVVATEHAKPRSRSTVAPSADTLSAEAKLVAQIKAAVGRGAPADALLLANDHARQFAGGTLAIEVTALRVLASCDLGRADDARRAAAGLRRAVPNHPVAAVAAEGCPAERSTKVGPAGEGEGI